MKNQWPIWVFVGVVIVIVFFAFNRPGSRETAPVSDILSEQTTEDGIPAIEYEFVDQVGNQEVPATDMQVKATTPSAEDAAAIASSATATSNSSSALSGANQGMGEFVKEKSASGRAPFTIQVASYKDRKRAELGLEGVKAAGHDGYIAEANVKGSTVYRLYVGQFSSKDEANSYLSKVRANYKDSFVISPK
ncbi:MAG: SPOR domain-containing protein [Candidatus Omnitrophica bacterium]|nr:SPOR domain-containing protein [Candidatus Omnitrophota bacterium]